MSLVGDSLECAKRIFSFDEQITEAMCEVNVLGSYVEGTVPGPCDAQYKGYFLCNQEYVEGLRDEYSWSKVDINITAEAMVVDKLNTSTWYYSKEFNKVAINPKFIGRIYFNGNFFWFDVSTH